MLFRSNKHPRLKSGLFIDIETDDTNSTIEVGKYRILSVATIDMQTGKSKFFVNDEERTLLRIVKEHINNYDVLVAWNGFGFDFPYIEQRFMKFGMFLDKRNFQFVDMMEEYKSKFSSYKYGLDYVGNKELGIGKIKHDKKIIEMFNTDRSKLMEYNINDVKIMYLDRKSVV